MNYLRRGLIVGWLLLLGGCDFPFEPPPPLTRDYARQLAAMPKEDYFAVGVYEGCEDLPAKDPEKKRLLGFDITGNKCYVEVLPSPGGKNHKVVFRFKAEAGQDEYTSLGPIEMTYVPNTDSFLGVLGEGDVFIAQYLENQFLSFTHTSYDEDGMINYGITGSGDYVRGCGFTKPTYLKGTDRCR